MRVLTHVSSAGEALRMLSSLERRSSRWDSDPEAARDALSAAVSLVLRLLGREPDRAKSREHVLLSVLAERRLAAGLAAARGTEDAAGAELATTLQRLAPRWFVVRNAHSQSALRGLRERKRAEELAAATNTFLVQVVDGKVVHVRPPGSGQAN